MRIGLLKYIFLNTVSQKKLKVGDKYQCETSKETRIVIKKIIKGKF